jgi:HAMP domain-containing protein
MNARTFNKFLLAGFAVAIVTSFLLLRYANNWLTASSTELSTLRSEVAALEIKQNDLNLAKATLVDQKNERQTLDLVLPTNKDQSRLIQELTSIAATAGVSINSISFPTSTLGTQVKTSAPAPADTTTDQTTTQTAPATPKAATISQATPIKEIPGVQAIDITIGQINSVGLPAGGGVRYSEMMQFIRLIERNQRSIQIKSIGISSATAPSGEPLYSLDVALTTFVRTK